LIPCPPPPTPASSSSAPITRPARENAEGLLRHLHGDRYDVFSAGTLPTEVHPLAIRAMAERGVDISGHRSKSLEEFRGAEFDLVVTVSRPGEGGLPLLPRRREAGPPELPRPRSRRRDRGGAARCLLGGARRDRGLDRGDAGVSKRGSAINFEYLSTYSRPSSSSLLMPACFKMARAVPFGRSFLWKGTTTLHFASGL